MRAKQFGRLAVAALAVTAFAGACSDDDDEPSDDTGVVTTVGGETGTTMTEVTTAET